MKYKKNGSNVYYKQVAGGIIDKIKSGLYGNGEKIPSERDLCKLYDVSRTTVRKAIDELVNEGYLVRKRGKGTFVSKTFFQNADYKKGSGDILFIRCIKSELEIIDPTYDMFYPTILIGIEKVVTNNGYHCLFRTIYENKFTLNDIDSLVKKVEGVIWGGEIINDTFLNYIRELDIPLVLISPSIKTDSIDTVNIDNENGANKAVKYLIENGHKKIAYIGGNPNSFPSKERKRGYIEALINAGIEVDNSLILSYGWSLEDGYKAVCNLLESKKNFTAIFAASDILALAAINALIKFNYSLPDDKSIIGFDNIELARQTKPKLTTIKVLKGEMGMAASELLFEQILKKRDYNLSITLPTELIIRESVSKLK